MPTYEFRCPNGHEFEQFYSRISLAPTIVECPTCSAVSEKLMSAGGLVFKGSGFYITDYGKDGKKDQQKPAAASTGDSVAATDATKSVSSDAKAPGESRTAGDGKTPTEAKPANNTKPASESKPSSDAKPARSADSSATKGTPKAPGGDA